MACEAVLLAGNAPGVTSGPAAILEHAPFGLSGRAGRASQSFAHEAWSTLLWEEREWSIPQWFWHACERAGRGAQNWELGRFGRVKSPVRTASNGCI